MQIFNPLTIVEKDVPDFRNAQTNKENVEAGQPKTLIQPAPTSVKRRLVSIWNHSPEHSILISLEETPTVENFVAEIGPKKLYTINHLGFVSAFNETQNAIRLQVTIHLP